MIEYAAFFGSFQIFQYLISINKDNKLDPCLWLFAIHGNNPIIIQLLEKMYMRPNYLRIEAIKCHHNEITHYIIQKYFTGKEILYNKEVIKAIMSSFNYKMIADFNQISNSNFSEIFNRIQKVEEITIPMEYTITEPYAYKALKNLKKVTFLQPDIKIGMSTFIGCNSLEINGEIQQLSENCFADCVQLKYMKINAPIKSIQFYAFERCLNLKEIELPSSLTTICKGAFEKCSSLKNITIPSNVTSIDQFAFYKCTDLEEVIFQTEKITEIKKKCFAYCVSLKTI